MSNVSKYKQYYPKGWFSDDVSDEDSLTIIKNVLKERHKGVSMDDILGKSRVRHIVLARQDCIVSVADKNPGLSYTRIGEIFNVDHSSVLYCLGRLKKKPTLEKLALNSEVVYC